MSRPTGPKLIKAGLALLLIGSLVGNVFLYRKATLPLYDTADRPLIERTIALAAAVERTDNATLRAHSFPIVFHLGGGRTCVELRDLDDRGHYTACYDRSGRQVEQIVGVD